MGGNQRELALVLKLQDQASKELRRIAGEVDAAERSSRNWGDTLFAVGKQLFYAATAAAGFLGYGVKIAADLETAEVGLTTLLGSAEKASATVDRLKVEAARTPFELPGLTQAAQLLASVTKDGDKAIDVILDIGEGLAAMGKGQAELDRISINLQQIAAVGHASMIDIKQFAYSGIPIFEMLEAQLSKGTTSLVDNNKKLGENGAELKRLEQQLAVAVQRQKDFTDNTSDATKMASKFRIDELRSQITGLNGEMGTLNATNGKIVSSTMSVEDAIAGGHVTFEMLTQMFDEANDAGGRFFDAYANNAGTFNQALSNMKDSFGIFLADVATGTGLFAVLTDAMMLVSSILGNYRTHLETARVAFSTFFSELDAQTGLVTLFKDVWANVIHVFNDQLRPALAELWAALQPLRPFLEVLGTVLGVGLVIAIGAVIIILGGLAAGIVQLLTWVTKLTTYLTEYFVTAWNAVIDQIAEVIVWVDKVIEKFKKAIDLASQIGGGLGGTLKGIGKVIGVNDAIISPKGDIITTHPDDYLIATKNPSSLGGGFTLNITGNTLLDQDAAEKMGDLILKRLKLSAGF